MREEEEAMAALNRSLKSELEEKAESNAQYRKMMVSRWSYETTLSCTKGYQSYMPSPPMGSISPWLYPVSNSVNHGADLINIQLHNDYKGGIDCDSDLVNKLINGHIV